MVIVDYERQLLEKC